MDIDDLEEDSSIDFKYYFGILTRGKWWLIIPAVLGLISGVFTSNILPKVYEAESLILVEEGSILNPLMGELAVSISQSQKLQIIRQEILSWPKLTRLVEELKLAEGIEKKSAQYESLINSIKQKINVSLRGKSSVISVAYEGQDPHHVQSIVKTLTNILIEKNLASQADDADAAIVFIEKQLEHYRLKLESSEEELRKFQEVYTVQLPVITKLNERLVQLQVQRNTLLIENTKQHPSVLAINQKIEQVRDDIENEKKRLLGEGIDISNAKYLDIARSVPRQQQEYNRLKRDRKVNEKLYETLLSKFESANISKKLDQANETTKFKILEEPRFPRYHIKPDKPRIMIMGFGIGLLFGLCIIVVKELMNTSYKTIEQVKKDLHIPVLGAIAALDFQPKDNKLNELIET